MINTTAVHYGLAASWTECVLWVGVFVWVFWSDRDARSLTYFVVLRQVILTQVRTTMAHTCCVMRCGNMADAHTFIFIIACLIPTWQGTWREFIVERSLWLLKISKAENSNTEHWRVCGMHFTAGKNDVSAVNNTSTNCFSPIIRLCKVNLKHTQSCVNYLSMALRKENYVE